MSETTAADGAGLVVNSTGDDSSCRMKCQAMMGVALEQSKVKTLLSEMKNIGCVVNIASFFKCRPCDNEGVAGGYVPAGQESATSQGGHVILCEDNLEKFKIQQSLVSRTIVHELIHAYDNCRAEMDWNNCMHVACTEVRAAHLSGDCAFLEEFNRGQFGFGQQGEKCIRRRAEISVNAQDNCKSIAKDAVDAVYNPCFGDRAPFFKKAPLVDQSFIKKTPVAEKESTK